MQRRTQGDAAANYLPFLQRDHRRDNFDFRFRPSPNTNHFLKRFVIFWPAIGISRAVLSDGSDVNRASTDGLRPADLHGKEMRVAEGNISNRNAAAVSAGRVQPIFRDGDTLVRQRGTSDGPKVIEVHD